MMAGVSLWSPSSAGLEQAPTIAGCLKPLARADLQMPSSSLYYHTQLRTKNSFCSKSCAPWVHAYEVPWSSQ